MTRVRSVLRIDLSAHVVPGGELGDAAAAVAWAVLATAEPGQAVDVNLGAARWLTERLLHILREGLADAGAAQVSGSDGAAMAKLAALLDERAS